MVHVTFVKKILEDARVCPKCKDVAERLDKDGTRALIDEIIYADLDDPKSAGMVLAVKYEVERAPFFIVEDLKTGDVEVFDIYFKFKRHMEKLAKVA